MFEINRRVTIASILSLLASKTYAKSANFGHRFEQIWREMDKKYCYFAENNIDWEIARQTYQPLAQQCKSENEFLDLIDALMRETMDSHTHIHNANEGAPRWPPYDLYVEDAIGACTIQAVHEYSAAKKSGLVKGDMIMEINDVKVYDLARKLKPKSLTKNKQIALNYLLNLAVAGNKGQERKIKYLTEKNEIKIVNLPLYKGGFPPDFESKMLEQNIGYIAIRTFGDNANIVEQFDEALAKFKDAKALIIDVRYNGGGDTAIARPIMGRFIKEKKPYAQMAKRKGKGLGEKWTEYVEPRGPFTFENPVVILCNHWSASMAEGFPMGMRAICGAKVMGTMMMGLGAAVYSSKAGGMDFQYSAEPVYNIHGRPRNYFMPDIMLDDTDDYIMAAQKKLFNI